MRKFAQTDSASAEKTKVAVSPTTDAATVVAPSLELGLTLLLFNQAFFCHKFPAVLKEVSR